jgi:ABC-type sugar transport system ATPase subunit
VQPAPLDGAARQRDGFDPSPLTRRSHAMATIRLDRVWKRYGPIAAVRDLSLTCADGEMLALLGPSGCGKTSTLKMVAGIEEVSEGEILFDERPVSQLAPAERNLAMVFEDYALYPHLSVFENIAFPLRIRRLPGAELERRVASAIALLGLDGLRDDSVRRLSGGAQQRVSIGRALVRDPELILFDEPLSHLDGDQKVQLRAEIKRLQQTAGLTAILVTHDQTEAIAMSDRVAVMNDGVLQQCDAPQQLYDHPQNLFVADFIGEPPMNLIPVALREADGAVCADGGGWHMALGRDAAGRLRRIARSGGVILGFRPEHVELLEPGASGQEADALAGRVAWSEMRGDSHVLTLVPIESESDGSAMSGEEQVTIEVRGMSPPEIGQPIAIRVRHDLLNLFNPETGRNLLTVSSEGRGPGGPG